MNKARDFDPSVVAELKALLGERVSTSAAVREHHGKDESYFPYALPDAVVFPATTDEVRDVVDICRRHRVPMIPFGVGTSPDGRIIQTARRAKKSAAGYDLTRLMIGSEGTLGIITEVTLRLYPVQDSMSAAVCAFPTIDGATKSVIQTLQMGIPVARSELLCATTMAALNRHNKLSYRESPTLFLEFHGTQASVVEQAKQVQEIARENGGLDFQWATRPEDRSKIWEARHNAYFACLSSSPARVRFRQTSACRSRAWPSASPKPRRRSSKPRCRSRSSATSATATSTS